MTAEMEVEKITATSIALRPPYKSRTSEPWPWADGQKRGVVEVGKHLCAPASRVAKSDRRCLLHRPLEPPGGHTLTGPMVPVRHSQFRSHCPMALTFMICNFLLYIAILGLPDAFRISIDVGKEKKLI